MNGDVRLVIKAKNARVLRAIERAGYRSVAELARACLSGESKQGGYSDFVEIINFKQAPLRKNGEWRRAALDIATALHVEPEELWPEYLQHVAMRSNETSLDVSTTELAAMAGRSSDADLIERDEVQRLLARLPERERQVIEMRYGFNGNGEHQYNEIGEELGVGVERVRQIEKRAMRRLYKPAARARGMVEPTVIEPPREIDDGTAAPPRIVWRHDDDSELVWRARRHLHRLSKAERALVELRFMRKDRISDAELALLLDVKASKIADMQRRVLDRLHRLMLNPWQRSDPGDSASTH